MVLEARVLGEVAVVPEMDLEKAPAVKTEAARQGVPEEEIHPPLSNPEMEGVPVVDLSRSGVLGGFVELFLNASAEGPEGAEGLGVAPSLLEGRHPWGDELPRRQDVPVLEVIGKRLRDRPVGEGAATGLPEAPEKGFLLGGPDDGYLGIPAERFPDIVPPFGYDGREALSRPDDGEGIPREGRIGPC